MAKIADKTLFQIKEELDGLAQNHWKDIKEAFNSGPGVTLTFKVDLEPAGGQVSIKPTVEFYPLPKYKSTKYEVLVDEYQEPLPFKKGGTK